MLIALFLPVVLTVIMFSLGLGLSRSDFALVVRQPRAFMVGAANQMILLPVIGFTIATVFALPPELAVGIMILSLCPGGVMSNVLARFAGGSVPLSVSLTAVISLVSIVSLPILTALSVAHFMGAEAPAVDVTSLGIQMFLLTAVPVALGMLLTAFLPELTRLISPWMSRITFVLFALLMVAALAANWKTFIDNISTLGPALVTMNIVLLALGVLTARFASLRVREATTVAIESGIQNGTLGIAVGGIVMGITTGLPTMTLPTAIYSVIALVIAIPFVLWRRSLVKSELVNQI